MNIKPKSTKIELFHDWLDDNQDRIWEKIGRIFLIGIFVLSVICGYISILIHL